MPVYLCQPGAFATEPWRHGIHVYPAPFDMNEVAKLTMSSFGPGSDASAGENNEAVHSSTGDHNPGHPMATSPTTERASTAPTTTVTNNNQTEAASFPASRMSAGTMVPRNTAIAGLSIRRLRHSEVVLVDDVCIAFDRYWLRLRWPGSKGGFAGYVALGAVVPQNPWLKNQVSTSSSLEFPDFPRMEGEEQGPAASGIAGSATPGEDVRVTNESMDDDDPTRDDEPQENASTLSSEPYELSSALRCLRTGLLFPSSEAMKLMAVYDDGLCPPVTCAPLPSEPVFCRICREGLHDDADDEQPSPAMDNEGEENVNALRSSPPSGESNASALPQDGDAAEEREPQPADPLTGPLSKGPIIPHPTYHVNKHAVENPLISPCECSGSMAFVHYLCVEQWRRRVNHPEAKKGLQCETCGKPYALPPPSARTVDPQMENDDWLGQMPPHVVAALRQPHLCWQIGAALVRRRWLRPIAPVLTSPIVALYCRARRLLKKKGVARRRWACSLCRRRAQWKCVRCLRSYYCSRQCQNVSWHIVHKHVCYKPSRWAWSVVVYGIASLFAFPGILRDPLMYDLGLGFVPVSFYVVAILAGGVATAFKKGAGMDLRGRAFEMLVLFSTVWLVVVVWGLVGAFFGNTSRCHGVFGSFPVDDDENQSKLLSGIRTIILKPAASWFLMWDRLALNSGPWFRKALCMHQEEGCFEHLHKANSGFFLEENGGEKCAADLSMVAWLFVSAGVVAVGSHVWKRRDRQRRAARRRPRPHQD